MLSWFAFIVATTLVFITPGTKNEKIKYGEDVYVLSVVLHLQLMRLWTYQKA
jgi:hypothetical protein